MNVSSLVVALVLRSGREGKFEQLSWLKLGAAMGLTQDQIRHRLTAFKKKYNVVEADVVEGWNRTFLSENCPDDEKNGIAEMDYYPGDVVQMDSDNDIGVILSFDPEDSMYTLICFNKEDGSTYRCEEEQEEFSGILAVTEEHRTLPGRVIAEDEIIEAPQFMITKNCLIVMRNGKPLTIDRSHKNYEKIQEALENQKWRIVFDLIDLKNTLTKFTNGRVTVEDGKVRFDSSVVGGKLADRLISCLIEENTEAMEALSNFLVKADENSDGRVLSRLFSFMQAKDIRIHKDGDFYAYKVVRPNYLDKHTGTMDNSPGTDVSMKRNLVNPIDSETCSSGLHVCSKSYIGSFSSTGDRIVLCKVNPRDVVSVPTDYGDAKMRVCRYIVEKDVTENFTENPGTKPTA